MENKKIETLKEFLQFPLWNSNKVFDKFKTINGAIFQEYSPKSLKKFLYIEGKKQNKIVLIAHADTYFDQQYPDALIKKHQLLIQNEFIFARDENNEAMPLGADDRAGCAMLWILKDSGHSLLITDGEEHGQIGSNWLVDANPNIVEKIEKHNFMIQLDRRQAKNFKCYSNCGTDEFRYFISNLTNYSEPDKKSKTDICALCDKINICGVNLSIGYYNEHTYKEKLNIQEWLNTLNLLEKILKNNLPQFKLNPN